MTTLKTFFMDFWNDEEGLETIEILLILAVLITIALLFKERLTNWANSLFDEIGNKLPGSP